MSRETLPEDNGELRERRRLELEAFKEEYKVALTEFSEIAADYVAAAPVSPDPMALGLSESTMEEMEDDELRVIGGVLWEVFGVDPKDPETFQRDYVSEVGGDAKYPGKIKVDVLKTNQEGVYIHEMKFENNPRVQWLLGDRDVDV